jgi:hypothetical protein
LEAVEFEIPFGSGDKEGAGQDKVMETSEIDAAPIHHIEGA